MDGIFPPGTASKITYRNFSREHLIFGALLLGMSMRNGRVQAFTKEKLTVTIKMADRERPDFHAVFTMIPCGTSFCIWQGMKLVFTG